MSERARPDAARVDAPRQSLTRREREILGMLSEGLSGAQIATKLVLSPETVRTHVRNAMAKLGATTRSQAVALALRQDEIASAEGSAEAARPSRPEPVSADAVPALRQMLTGLVSLYDVDGGAVYLCEADGLALRRVAEATGSGFELPETVALGDGTLGRAALERRSQVFQSNLGQNSLGSTSGALIVVPILAGGQLLGVIALGARVSRPVGRSELLLLQAFSKRVGEVVASGTDVDQQLERAMDRFRTSWSAATRVA